MDFGLLLVRVVFGGLMAGHGAQKLFGWFGGYGLSGTGGFLESLGYRPGRLFAALAGGSELLGGLLLALGILGPVGPVLFIAVMVVAAGTVHLKNGLWAQNQGIELPLLYALAAAGLAFTGYGAYSLDRVLALDALWLTVPAWATISAGVAAGLANLAIPALTRGTAREIKPAQA